MGRSHPLALIAFALASTAAPFIPTTDAAALPGPVARNLTPEWQGNAPVFRFSLSDSVARLSRSRLALDLYVHSFDPGSRTYAPPQFKGTLFPSGGLSLDSMVVGGAGGETAYYTGATHFDLKHMDRMTAVVYGGLDGDWANDSTDATGLPRQYGATGGARDTLGNAGTPLVIQTLITLAEPEVILRLPSPGISRGCVGPDAAFRWEVLAEWDSASVVVRYLEAETGRVLSVRHAADLRRNGDILTDEPHLGLDGVRMLRVALSLVTLDPRHGGRALTSDLAVDVTGPVVNAPAPLVEDRQPKFDYWFTDECAGSSAAHAVDVFAEAYDSAAATLRPPIFLRTYTLGDGIAFDSTWHGPYDVPALRFQLATGLELAPYTRVRAVIYGGQPGDRIANSTIPGGYVYSPAGGPRDVLGNASAPMEVSRTVPPSAEDVAVVEFGAAPELGQVRISWRVFGLGPGARVIVERAPGSRWGSPGTYIPVSDSIRPLPGAPRMTFLDRDLEPRRTYWYRIVVRQPCCESVSDPISFEAPAAAFRLHPVGQNPVHGPVTVHYELADPGSATLSLYDVAGRRALVLDRGERTAGGHSVPLDPAGLRSGVYYLVLNAPAGRLQRRITLVK